MKKCVGSLQKQNGRSFQYTKFSVIDFVLIDRRNLLGTQPKLACSKSSSTRFSFSAARNAITKTTKCVTFGFYVRILVFSPLERSLSVSYSGHNPTNDLGLRMARICCSFINLTEWRKRRVTCQHLIGDIKHKCKNLKFFHVCCYGFSHRWKSLYNTVV